MFGLDRRPEPYSRRDHGVIGMEMLREATNAPSVHLADVTHIHAVKRAHDQIFRGKRPAEDRDLLHAAMPIADLLAFEIGRLP
jgi:hypothetical protein